MDRAQRLLRSGYFPSQLPPPFSTDDLSDHYAAFYAAWLALQPPAKKGLVIPRAPSSKCELFSVARAAQQRRMTSISNPVAQTYLSVHISQHWADLLKHFRKSRLSASRPRFLKNGQRAANIPPMQQLYEKKVLKSAGYRILLRSDISKFFPTIYTHSIPWALHSKSLSKKNKNVYTSKFFGNLLDLAIRQGQEEQTFGVPIGPDTSHVIAEVIGTALDLELKRRLKVWPVGFRYVDDYFLFFTSTQEADAALAALVRSLKEFELQVNFDKTRRCSVIEISDDYWTHQIRGAEISGSARKQESRIHQFFELAKELARKNPSESVMAYALKRTSSSLIRPENWSIFEAHLVHIGLAYPNTLQIIARLFVTYAALSYPLNKQRIEQLVNSLIAEHAPLEHHSEVAWCLWMSIALSLRLADSSIDTVSEMHSSICALLLLDLHQAGRLKKAPKLNYWKQFANEDSLHGDLWLLAYEAGVRGWGGFTATHVIADRHFSLLHAAGVRFYRQQAVLSPFFTLKETVLQQAQTENLQSVLSRQDIEDFLDFSEEEDDWYGVGSIATDDESEELPF